MGFVIAISFAITNAATGNPKIEELIESHPEWKNYASTLTEIRTIENKPLGGHRPLIPPGESNVDEEEEQHDADSIFDKYRLGFPGLFHQILSRILELSQRKQCHNSSGKKMSLLHLLFSLWKLEVNLTSFP
jgi:hypothetical protein